jgi:ribonucleoside-diphosphate reductase alpha chain
MLTQQNWIEYGTTSRSVQPWLRHNVSNTISVKTEEWDDVEKFIYDNKKWFGGISLLPFSGDLDYPQAPFSNILNEKELIAEYGEGSLFASGLIVDGLDAFSNNLWAACDCALDIGQPIVDLIKPEEPIRPAKNGFTDKQHASKLIKYAGDLKQYYDDLETFNKEEKKKDWVRRFKQFATRYVDSDLRKCSHLLKHVSLWKLWLDLKREYQEVDWSLFMEEDFKFDMNTLAAASCSAGGCELK